MLKIKNILIKWLKNILKRLDNTENKPLIPVYEKGEMYVNDSVLLCYLVEFNKNNELMNNPKFALIHAIGKLSQLYEADITIEKLAEIDSIIKAVIGKIINEKAVDSEIYINYESTFLNYLGGNENANVPKM